MDRGEAYGMLSRELQAWKARPYEQLVAHAGLPASARVIQLGDEDVTVRVSVRWESEAKGTLRVEATADGPSCWRLERLEESIVVRRGQ